MTRVVIVVNTRLDATPHLQYATVDHRISW